AIFRDQEGVVWFGSDRGVCRYDRSSFRASTVSNHPQSNFTRVMLNTSGGETLVGTNRGLFKLTTGGESSNPKEGNPKEGNPKEGKPKEGNPKEGNPKEASGGGGSDSWAEVAELEGRSIYALAESEGAIWAGAGGGLFVKPKGASGFSRVPSATDAKASGAGANEADKGGQEEAQQPAQGQITPPPDASSA